MTSRNLRDSYKSFFDIRIGKTVPIIVGRVTLKMSRFAATEWLLLIETGFMNRASPASRGCGLKLSALQFKGRNLASPASRGCGLKLVTVKLHFLEGVSPASRGCGLKHPSAPSGCCCRWSPASRGCGLKPLRKGRGGRNRSVARFTRVRIETCPQCSQAPHGGVARFTRVRIETPTEDEGKAEMKRRPLHAGAD